MSIVELTKDSFQDAITPDGTLIVDFWAPWCGPCRGFAPVFEQAATEHPDVTFAKVNTDVEQELAGALGIRSIPTLMVFREKCCCSRSRAPCRAASSRNCSPRSRKWTWKRSTRKSPPRRTARTPDPAAPFRKSKASARGFVFQDRISQADRPRVILAAVTSSSATTARGTVKRSATPSAP